jgi:hexosaminidase
MRLSRAVLTAAVVSLAAAGVPASASAATTERSVTDVVPAPVSAKADPKAGFRLTPSTVISADRGAGQVADYLRGLLRPATGYPLPVVPQAAGKPAISLKLGHDTRIGTEGYELKVSRDGVALQANTADGLFEGVQSLRQLLPVEIFRDAPVAGVRWTVPAVTIEDRPRFPWRGAHLDVSRHFMPKEFVKKYIDLLALHKMSSFHWHLTDDQGWRIEIRKYPRLTQVGAWRAQTLVGRAGRDTSQYTYDKKRHGGFYTQDDAREIVAYAAERFINVVPEIEMPGHSQAAIAAYPSLGNFGDTLQVWTAWGVSPHILNPSDTTIAFMQDVLTEVMALFPSKFIHVGGDEAVKTQWKASPRAQERIRALGLKDEDELQSWFIKQMDAFLTAHGRRLVGWDEILEGGLAPNAVVMSWRGIQGGIAAASQGHDVVMTPGSHTYFDHYQADRAVEPLAIGGFLPIDTVYSYEPVPAELAPAFIQHILGAQAQVWTEYIEGPKNVEYMAYPRMCALAEVLWTPRDKKDFADFSNRLTAHLARLDALDVNYRPR